MKNYRAALKARLTTLLLGLALTACVAAPVFGAAPQKPEPLEYANDLAGVLDAEAKDAINYYGAKLQSETGTELVLVTVNFLGGEDIYAYATEIMNQWGVGDKEKQNGALILLSVGDRDYVMVTGTGLEQALPPGEIAAMLAESLEPFFEMKDYRGGATSVYGAALQKLGGQWTSAESGEHPYDRVFVQDEADVLSSKTVDEINRLNRIQFANNQTAVYIATTRDTDGLSLEDYTYNLADYAALENSVVLMVLHVEDGEFYVAPGGEVARLLSPDPVINAVEPPVVAGDFDGAALKAVELMLPMMASYRPTGSDLPSKEQTSPPSPQPLQPGVREDVRRNDGVSSNAGIIGAGIGLVIFLAIIIAVAVVFSAIMRGFGRFGGYYYTMPLYRPRWYHRMYFWRPLHYRYPPAHRRYRPPPPPPPPGGRPGGFGGGRSGGGFGGGRPPSSGAGMGASGGGWFGGVSPGGGGSSRGSGAGRSSARGFGSGFGSLGGGFGGRRSGGSFGAGRSGGFGGGRSGGGFGGGRK